MSKYVSRREFLRVSALTATGAFLAACAPAPAEPEVVEVEVEKEVVIKETVIVAGTPEVVERVVTATSAAAPPPQDCTIRFITNDVGWREERYVAILAGFQEEYPYIDVEYTHTTANWVESLTTWAAAGTMPDVFYSRTQQTQARARLGWILPITDYLDADPDRDELLDDFWPVQVPQLQYKGDWYLIPENISSIAMKIRTEAFEAAGIPYPEKPWTIEEFFEVCKALTIREGDETTQWGFDPSWYLIYSGFAWIWLPAGIVDTANNTCIIDHPENARYLNFIQDMKFKERVIPRSEDIPEGIDMFAGDRAAIMESGVWEITSVRDSLGEDKHWDVVFLPDNPLKEGENLSINYGAGYAMGKDVPDRDCAWALLRYLSRPEMQDQFIVQDNWALPGRKSVTEAWLNHVLESGSGEPEHAAVWPEALETGRSVPVTPAEKEIEDQYPNLIAPILTTGEARAEEILPQVRQEIQAILDKYVD